MVLPIHNALGFNILYYTYYYTYYIYDVIYALNHALKPIYSSMKILPNIIIIMVKNLNKYIRTTF